MIVDARSLPAGHQIDTDLCIIGAGAAGIAIARQFLAQTIRVCVLESGGFDSEQDTQALYRGESAGRGYFPLEGCRLRYFGGSTNHWAGHCGVLSPADFEPRPWIPYSGWPIRLADLEPYYRRAHPACELGPFDYRVATWSDAQRQYPSFDRDKIHPAVWQYSPPTRFGTAYREEIQRATRVTVFLHANVTELLLARSADHVEEVRIATLTGGHGTVRARFVVLACGGIENPRLLLASRSVDTNGVGNTHDLVGRFFMDHPHVDAGTITTRRFQLVTRLFEKFQQHGVPARVGMSPSAIAQQRERVLNLGATIYAAPDPGAGYHVAVGILNDLKRLDWPTGLIQRMWQALSDLDDVVRGTASRLRVEPYERPRILVLRSRSEQAPNPSSRVTLSDRRDALGMPRARLEWRLSPIDRRTVRRVSLLVGEELARLDLGRLRLADWLVDDEGGWTDSMVGGSHHMGTTRMADDPADGVVDRNCRIHGIDNLFIAGSSVFPTVGFMNPTLTIVALALRLADHLVTRL